MGDPASIASDVTQTEARDYALKRLVHRLWGIPERTQDQLMDEFVDAGFTDVRAERLGLVRVFATRPLVVCTCMPPPRSARPKATSR